MQKTILVPLDGSPFSEQALPLALALAGRMEARLELVLVWSPHPRDPDPGKPGTYLDRAVELVRSQLPGRVSRELLSLPAQTLEYPPPAMSAVADVIDQHASDIGAALIVMTTHGHGGLRRAWLGSVADAVIRMATVPVLLVRPQDEEFTTALAADRGLHHILVPLDGTADAETAIPHALALGEPFGARYTLMRVVSPLAWEVSPHAYDPYPVHASPLSRDAVHQELEAIAESLRRRGHTVDVNVTDDTSPARAIVEFAEAHAVDLVAIGTSGRGPLRRLLLGSVSDKIIRGSDAPILICNARRVHAADEPAAAAAATTST